MAGHQTADATSAPTGPRQDPAERGHAAEEVVYGDVTTGAGMTELAGTETRRIIEECYKQALATLQAARVGPDYVTPAASGKTGGHDRQLLPSSGVRKGEGGEAGGFVGGDA
jgi:hypothetical protein